MKLILVIEVIVYSILNEILYYKLMIRLQTKKLR